MILETRSIVDALRIEIQRQILHGSIPPGMAIAEQSVAQTFDVARRTARAAIEQLVHIGLLRRSRNRKARVPLLNADDVADLYLSRIAVEGAAVRVLAERGEVPRAAAKALDRFLGVLTTPEMLNELVESDVEFHRSIVAAAQSPRLRRLHEAVIGETHLCMAQVQLYHLVHPQVTAAEHLRIVETIETRDVDGAIAELESHLARAQHRLIAHLDDAKPAVAA